MEKNLNPFLILTYEVPKEFKASTNAIYSGIHWRKRKVIVDYFHWISFEDCREVGKIDFLISLRFKFYFKSKYLDHLNLAFMSKAIEDWFVKNWLLDDDTNKFISEVNLKTVLLDKDFRKEMSFDYVEVEFYKEEI